MPLQTAGVSDSFQFSLAPNYQTRLSESAKKPLRAQIHEQSRYRPNKGFFNKKFHSKNRIEN